MRGVLEGLLAAGGGGASGIKLVGSKVVTNLTPSASWDISLTDLSGGVGASPSVGDFVVVFYAVGNNSLITLSVETEGYTQHASLYVNDSRDTNMILETKYLTTAETEVSVSGIINTASPGAVVVMAFRNVDALSPLDVAVQTSETPDTVRPSPPSITPATAGAWVVACGAGCHLAQVKTYSAADLDGFITAGADGSSTQDVTIGAGYRARVSGAQSFNQFTFSSTFGTTTSSAAITLALRPA